MSDKGLLGQGIFYRKGDLHSTPMIVQSWQFLDVMSYSSCNLRDSDVLRLYVLITLESSKVLTSSLT
jgi:hypothetical protein